MTARPFSPGSQIRAWLGKGLWRLLKSWWRGDRIRASFGEGRLLHLANDCILLIQDEPALVLGRSIDGEPEQRRLLYRCLTRTEAAQLEVRLRPSGGVELIRWHAQGRTFDLHEEDIERFSPLWDN